MRWKDGFEFEYGVTEEVSPLIRRVVARNPSPYTGPGTTTFIIGRGDVAIIDPGPALPEHIAAVARAVAGERVTHLLVSHTHSDHSPATKSLQTQTRGVCLAYGPSPPILNSLVDGAYDLAFRPDQKLRDGDRVQGTGWTLTAVHTPGHASNHLCFALEEERTLFTGDHVMGWASSVIPPPDGDMTAYQESLVKLQSRDDVGYWSSHGAVMADPKERVATLIKTRERRAHEITVRLQAGDTTARQIAAQLYPQLPSELAPAAAAMVLAQLIAFVRNGAVETEPTPGMSSVFRLRR